MKKSRLKILGIIGDPISHSLSPIMHNSALAHLKLPYLYMPFHVVPDKLDEFFKTFKKRNIHGLNVTIPHKQAVIPYMDSLTKQASLIGAVNTIIVKNKKLIGDNTDAQGYLESLAKQSQFDLHGKRVILLGAGGAARAIAIGLNQASEVLILNRTLAKAIDLAQELNFKFKQTHFAAYSLTKNNPQFWKHADLLINTTSMGMKNKKLADLPLKFLSKQALVSDIVYTPLETSLLKQAKKLGLKTHPGWGMLLYQGALSFKKWTGHEAPLEVMKKNLLEALKN